MIQSRHWERFSSLGGCLLGGVVGGRPGVGKGGGRGRRKVLSLYLLVRERAEAVAEAHGSMLITLLLVLSHPQTMRVWLALALRLGTF